MRRAVLLALFVLFAAVRPACAADYYVRLTGSDTPAGGSFNNPFHTIQYAVNHVPDGVADNATVIYVDAGQFAESPDGVNGQLRIVGKNYLTINGSGALPGVGTQITTQGYHKHPSGVLYVENSTHIQVWNLIVGEDRDWDFKNAFFESTVDVEGTADVTLRACEVVGPSQPTMLADGQQRAPTAVRAGREGFGNAEKSVLTLNNVLINGHGSFLSNPIGKVFSKNVTIANLYGLAYDDQIMFLQTPHGIINDRRYIFEDCIFYQTGGAPNIARPISIAMYGEPASNVFFDASTVGPDDTLMVRGLFDPRSRPPTPYTNALLSDPSALSHDDSGHTFPHGVFVQDNPQAALTGRLLVDDSIHLVNADGFELVAPSGLNSGWHGGYYYELPANISGNGWTMKASLSDTAGLALSDIVLHNDTGQSRYMAQQISIPYCLLATGAFPQQRFLLRPNSNAASARSRVVNAAASIQGDTLVVEATYRVDRIPAGSESYLLVVQRYEFKKLDPNETVTPTLGRRVGPILLPPAESLQAARFKPLVRYEFHGRGGESLIAFNTAQRLDLQNNAISANTAAVFSDHDVLFAAPSLFDLPFDVLNNQNPLQTEVIGNAIANGQKGDWDNYQQTWLPFVTAPPLPPTCPEGIQIHWRWGEFLKFPDGKPLIPPGSNQTVDFAVARPDRTVQPEEFASGSLSNAQPLQDSVGAPDTDLTFWYYATGHQNQDTFFLHGGFFAPPARDVTSQVKVTYKRQFNSSLGDYSTLVLFVKNTSGQTIKGPVSFVLDTYSGNANPSGIGLSGYTLGAMPRNSPYFNLYLKGNLLRPNETAGVEMEFYNADGGPITFIWRALASPGLR